MRHAQLLHGMVEVQDAPVTASHDTISTDPCKIAAKTLEALTHHRRLAASLDQANLAVLLLLGFRDESKRPKD